MENIYLRKPEIWELNQLIEMYDQLRIDEQDDQNKTLLDIKREMEEFFSDEKFEIFLLVAKGIKDRKEERKQEGKGVKEEVLGYGMVNTSRKPLYLRHLFVRRNHRKKGYGKKIIELLMEHYNIYDIDIEVYVWNKNAFEFYKHIGFIERCYSMRLKK